MLIKAPLLDQLLVDQFTKLLLPPISRDVSMGGVVTEEQAINRAQYLDLMYSQSGTLYDLIMNAPSPTNDPLRPIMEPLVDGLVDFVQSQPVSNQNGKNTKSTSFPTPMSKVSQVQSSSSSGGKKKGNKIF